MTVAAKVELAADDLSGQPFTLEHFRAWVHRLILDNGEPFVPEAWQESFIEDMFSGTPECWLIVPEGNGKTTLLSAIALYHIRFTRSGSVPVAASSREQAEILYRQAEGFVQRSELKEFRCQEGYRRIRCDSMFSRIQVFAADDRTGDGVIPTLCLVDELHRHRDMRLYRTWRGKIEKRRGQIVTISTAGEPGSEFEQARERIRQSGQEIDRTDTFVRSASPQLVLHEWAVTDAGDVEDMALVKAANPFSGITEDTLREKFASQTMTLAHWRRFTCNLPTRSDQAAIQESEWDAARIPDPIPAGKPVWVGLDVAWKWDTTAAVPLWFRDIHFRQLGPARVLVPPRDGTSLDPDLVEGALRDIHERNPIHTVVMDMSRAEQLGRWIETTFGARVVDRSQTNPLAVEDYERFMEALRSGWLKHSGDADLTRHALNAIARMLPLGDVRFDRPVTSRKGSDNDQEMRVIDALAAASMVHSVAVAEAEAEPPPKLGGWAFIA